MLYSASARRRAVQRRTSSRGSSRGSLVSSRGGSSRGSLVSPSSSNQNPPKTATSHLDKITLEDEPWPNTIAFDEDDGPSFQINESKRNPLHKLLHRASFRAPFFKVQSKEHQNLQQTSHKPLPKKRQKFDPQDFVKLERERVGAIRELINAEDFNAALKSLMSDTDADFHYFNKVKNETISTQHEEAFARRHGKLKSSLNETSLVNDRTCLWHGETDRGFPLRCHNKCLNHPYEKVNNHLGVPLPRPLDFCAYHVRYCVETIKHADIPIRIRVPNEHALCNECFVLKTNTRPPTLNRIPGTRRKRN